jgi:RNA polymerase sigma factor (sigma-70 family)
MDDHRAALALEFDRHRDHLRRVAYRMLGTIADAEDAVQETWVRLDRNPPRDPANLRPWLTAVLAHICTDQLRARRARHDRVSTWLPEPIVTAEDTPEAAAALADSIGLALMVVLETLSPSERVAFVLHDVFGLPFTEIAAVVERSPEAARQLASRARRRVRAAAPSPDADLAVQHRAVDAFLAAARAGDLAALLEVLDPDVVLRLDPGPRAAVRPAPLAGRDAVAAYLRDGARTFARLCRPALVNGAVGLVVGRPGRVMGVVGLSVVGGRVREVDIVGDPAKLERVDIRDAAPDG